MTSAFESVVCGSVPEASVLKIDASSAAVVGGSVVVDGAVYSSGWFSDTRVTVCDAHMRD